jgi:hypothetical protein
MVFRCSLVHTINTLHLASTPQAVDARNSQVADMHAQEVLTSPTLLSCCRFVLCSDKRLLHLKQYSHSPVTWFRNPMTHLVLVSSCKDVHIA